LNLAAALTAKYC